MKKISMSTFVNVFGFLTLTLTACVESNAPDVGEGAREPAQSASGVEAASAPSVGVFRLPASSSTLSVQVAAFSAADASVVTGYLITESSTPPGALDSRWRASPQTSVIASAAGARTFYAWVKDGAGRVSVPQAAIVVITLVDTVLPVVSEFQMAALSSSLTVSVTRFTATDNVGVAGYLITESSTKPSATVSGWRATAPATVVATAGGSKVFYAWAKDAAGNVSAAKSASVSISLPDLTLPVVSEFAMPATGTSLTVPVTRLTATDNVAVTGYLITESATKPLATALGWSATAPATAPATGGGSRTFYGWAKDAAGNVSASRSATVVLTVPDAILPVVTEFILPATSSSLTIPVTRLTATDGSGVTGYMITESSTKPLATASGWTSSVPASIVASGGGSKIFYAWAKDAAGNVSAAKAAGVTITVPVYGDCDGNGALAGADLDLLLNMALGIVTPADAAQKSRCDLNSDNTISMIDALTVEALLGPAAPVNKYVAMEEPACSDESTPAADGSCATGTPTKNFYCQLGGIPVGGLCQKLRFGASAQLAVGKKYSCFSSQEALYCTGTNGVGQLGNGTQGEVLSAGFGTSSTVFDSAVKMVAASAGHDDDYQSHTCAIRKVSGIGVERVHCWGHNSHGELGVGDTIALKTTPQVVSIPLKGTTDNGDIWVSTGGHHTCAIKNDTGTNRVYCWGYNGQKQVNDSAAAFITAPVEIPSLAGATRVYAGYMHTCAIDAQKKVQCWGSNAAKALGRSSFTGVMTGVPGEVSNLYDGVIELALHLHGGCALKTTGKVACWGYNRDGQVGMGTVTDDAVVADIPNVPRLVALAGGDHVAHHCAIDSASRVWCWGYNDYGQLGLGISGNPTVPSPTPLQHMERVSQIAVGRYHSCAIKDQDQFYCWGLNDTGALGRGDKLAIQGPSFVPIEAKKAVPTDISSSIRSKVVSIGLGAYYSCFLSGGQVKCAGENSVGQLGYGSTVDSSVPVTVLTGATMVSSAPNDDGGSEGTGDSKGHSCAIRSGEGDTEALYCWGFNDAGQIGRSGGGQSSSPVGVTGMEQGVKWVSAGAAHTCAIKEVSGQNRVYCWGFNGYGQTGQDRSLNVHYEPREVAIALRGATEVHAGRYMSCAVVNGAVSCWGHNGHYGLGRTNADSQVPSGLENLGSGVRQIALHYHGGCALKDDGRVWCWGFNGGNALITNRVGDVSSPVDIGLSGMKALSRGTGNTTGHCALNAAGELTCWGYNDLYQARPWAGGSLAPYTVPHIGGFVEAAVSRYNACALNVNGRYYCWGANGYGQLGTSDVSNRLFPIFTGVRK